MDGRPNSLDGIFTVRQKNDQLSRAISTPNVGLWCALEGGKDASNFNNLLRWAKGQVRFPPVGAFQAEHQN